MIFCMKKYFKEMGVLALQLFMFYIFPLFAGPTDAMGMVLLIILATLLFSAILGGISEKGIKYFYPLVAAVVFLPSVFIYYNESALIHSVWYLVVSAVGLLFGAAIRFIVRKIRGAN